LSPSDHRSPRQSAEDALSEEASLTAYKQHRLKQFVTSQIEFDLAVRAGSGESVEGMSGSVWVSQAEYGPSQAGEDQRLALGGTFLGAGTPMAPPPLEGKRQL
jgi:hypothetical protein